MNIYEAKAHLSQLIDQAITGENVVIARAGKPLVRLIPVARAPQQRVPGAWKGKVWVAADFDTESEEINELFYGSGTVEPS